MELGPIQQAWIKSLREHPERQMEGFLGKGTPDNYRACCLGEYLCIYREMTNKDNPFQGTGTGYEIRDGGSNRNLQYSYKVMGLRNQEGEIEGHEYESLARMNDSVYSWTEIADFIEANPEKVFTKSI